MSTPMETAQLVDGVGAPIGTAANPLVVSSGTTTNPYPGSDYAKDGADASGVTVPTGGSGIRGWLSGIYAKLSATLQVQLAAMLPSGTNTIGQVILSSGVTVTEYDRTGTGAAENGLLSLVGVGSRRFLQIHNGDTASDMRFTFGANVVSATQGIRVGPGGTFTYDSVVPLNALNVFAASGKAYTIVAG